MDANAGAFIIDFGYLSLALLAGVFLRAKVQIIQKMFMPSAVIAGTILMVLNLTGVISFSPEGFITYALFLLMAAFAAIGLRQEEQDKPAGILASTGIISTVYVIQVIAGLLLIFLLIRFYPTFPVLFGFNLFMGFGGDYITALSIGTRWEMAGFFRGGYTGAVFGIIGVLWAYIVGIILINWGIRKNKFTVSPDHNDPVFIRGVRLPEDKKQEAGAQTTVSHSLDALALHIALVGGVVFVSYTIMNMLVSELNFMGTEFTGVLWNLSFVPALFLGMLTRRFVQWLGVDYIIDKGLLTRTGNLMFDYMITASIASIPVILLKILFTLRWPELLILTIGGGIITLLAVYWLSGLTRNYSFERAVPIFGFLTGNAFSGIALMRFFDPDIKNPVSLGFVYAMLLSLAVWYPLTFMAEYLLIYTAAGRAYPALVTSLVILVISLVSVVVIFFVYRVARKAVFKKRVANKH